MKARVPKEWTDLSPRSQHIVSEYCIDMSRQRMCTRAYWEYRQLFKDICDALREYSEEWKLIIDNQMKPKCEALGYCPEKHSCGRADAGRKIAERWMNDD